MMCCGGWWLCGAVGGGDVMRWVVLLWWGGWCCCGAVGGGAVVGWVVLLWWNWWGWWCCDDETWVVFSNEGVCDETICCCAMVKGNFTGLFTRCEVDVFH